MPVSGGVVALHPTFLTALASVPPSAWGGWFDECGRLGDDAPPITRTLVATFALPPSGGHAALLVFETVGGPVAGRLMQAALRRWTGEAPPDAEVLYQENDADGTVAWTLATAWADADLRAWLREALAAGAQLRGEGGWEWLAAPERPAAGGIADGGSRPVTRRRHDVVFFEAGAVAISYRQLSRGTQPELDLLRHLERVPAAAVAPTLLGSAILRSPTGQRSASALLETVSTDAATVKSVVVARLHRALDGDPSLQAAALDDVRAAGLVARELHAALGRPFEQGLLAGATPATRYDVDSWVARAWTTLSEATHAARHSGLAIRDAALAAALDAMPGKLQQFAAAAESAPGLTHRTHGSLRLEAMLIAPPRALSVVELDGDLQLPDAERDAPQSPWRDVASLLVSIAGSAAEAARRAGGDDHAFEIAWLWEREARKACLEGYGAAGGALHALLAIFEIEYTARLLRDATPRHLDVPRIASHTFQRLSRTIV